MDEIIDIKLTVRDIDFLTRWLANNLATLDREKGPEVYDKLQDLFMELLEQGYPSFPPEYQQKFRELGRQLGMNTDEMFGVDPSDNLKKVN